MISRRTILELWERRADPNAAMALLAASNEFIKAGKPLPPLLAQWHSAAIDAALSAKTRKNGKPIEHERANTYARALNIARSDNAPIAFVSKRWLAMAILVQGDDYCEMTLRKDVQREFDVSAGTARTRIRDAKRAIEEARHCFRLASVQSAPPGQAG